MAKNAGVGAGGSSHQDLDHHLKVNHKPGYGLVGKPAKAMAQEMVRQAPKEMGGRGLSKFESWKKSR